MTTQKVTSRIIRPVTHRVYARRRKVYGMLPYDGNFDGWVIEPRLRCEWVNHETGAAGPKAMFTFVPLDASEKSVEKMLAYFSTDDHVKVVVDPLDDDGFSPYDPLSDGEQGFIVFEGLLRRPLPTLQSRADGVVQALELTAWAMPRLDNGFKMVRGRSIKVEEEIFGIETPDLPAVFNFGGRPNMARDKTITAQAVAQTVTLTAPTWTHDDDPSGAAWTVREALLWILVNLIYGAEETGRQPRNLDIYQSSAEALLEDSTTAARADRFKGLDDILPEVNIQGLGCLEAFETVCDAAGFDMVIETIDTVGFELNLDRRHVLGIWRRNTGRLQSFDLAAGGSTYDDVEKLMQRNNVPRFQATFDAEDIVNHVSVAANSYIEATFPIKPMWSPDEIDDAEIDKALQTTTKEKKEGDGYHAKHVVGGVLYKKHGHVGRVWGIDCVGGFDGYETGDAEYAHDEDGFDFVVELDLNNADNAIKKRRVDAGITNAIAWTKRQRQPLPLISPEARRHGIQYALEVSEDGGAEWQIYPRKFKTLRDLFAIQIEGIDNLASYNMQVALGNSTSIDVDKSWWKLIKDKSLRMRLTCVVIADHANRAEARRQPTSASIYPRQQWMSVPVEEYWIQPDTPFNDANELGTLTWKRIAGVAVEGSDELKTSASVQELADRRRDLLEDVRVSVTASTPIMDFKRYQIGNRISGLRGRDISFASNVGPLKTYPSIVAIKYILGRAESQAIEVSLEDQRMAGVR